MLHNTYLSQNPTLFHLFELKNEIINSFIVLEPWLELIIELVASCWTENMCK